MPPPLKEALTRAPMPPAPPAPLSIRNSLVRLRKLASRAARLATTSPAAQCALALLVGWSVMLLGGLLLWAAESRAEFSEACQALAEENSHRMSMRLPAVEFEGCV